MPEGEGPGARERRAATGARARQDTVVGEGDASVKGKKRAKEAGETHRKTSRGFPRTAPLHF